MAVLAKVMTDIAAFVAKSTATICQEMTSNDWWNPDDKAFGCD